MQQHINARMHLRNTATPFPQCFAVLSAGLSHSVPGFILFFRHNNGHCVASLRNRGPAQYKETKNKKNKHVYGLIKTIRNRTIAEKWKVCECRLSVIKAEGRDGGEREKES